MHEERSPAGVDFVFSQRARVLFTTACVAVLLVGVGWVFWAEDVRYMLPTPRPDGLAQPPVGAALPVDAWLARAGLSANGRPVHLHVFNPDCPCSRFNADHIRALVQTYGDRVVFVGLVQGPASVDPDEAKDAMDAAAALHLGMPLWLDEGGAVAHAAGVYATPQAVLVGADQALVYRGNYNESRYHVDPRTEFARLALESLVGRGGAFVDPETPAYGCELPTAPHAAITQAPRGNP